MSTPEADESTGASPTTAPASALPPPPSGAVAFELPPPTTGAIRFDLPPPA